MATVMMPTEEVKVKKGRKSGAGFGSALGAVAGAALGASAGPAGIAKGAMMGQQVGGMIGGMVQPGREASAVQQPGSRGIQSASTGAVDRRLGEIQQSPQFQLQQAKAALAELPPQVQKDYAQTIDDALAASRKAQKVGMA